MSKTGSYAVTTTLPWKKKTKVDMIGKRKKKNARSVIHPIFEKCSSLTDDKFWVSVFQNCARNKFPRYFYFKNNLLTYRKGNKINRLEVSKSPPTAYIEIWKFFQNQAGILSTTDRKRRQKEEEQKMLEKTINLEDMSWKDVKTDKLKELLITEFIDNICHDMEFNLEEKADLTTTVKKGFMMKYFTSSNIYMEEGKIIEISGLYYDEEADRYEIEEEYISKRPGRKIFGLGVELNDGKLDIDFMDLWSKYLDKLEDKKSKKTYSSSTTNESDEFTHSFSLPSL